MPETNHIRAVIFDWDGTLLNSYRADSAAYLKMFRAVGITWGLEELAQHYSPDWYRVYRAAGLPRSRWPQADRLWGRYYDQQQPRLMPGARRVLRELARRHVLAVVTSGNRARVVRQHRLFDLHALFATRVFAEDTVRRKPHPAPLRLALRRLCLPAEACIYVGDAPEDIQMAHTVGMRAIGVLGPFPTHRRLRAARPAALLKSISELPRYLLSSGF